MSNPLATARTTELAISQIDVRLKYLFEHGVNFKSRSITLDAEIERGAFRLVDAALSEFESDSRKSVLIKLNSPGGSVYDAMAIVGRLRASKCQVITEGYGHIMSAAALIFACGDKRRISEYATFMVHETNYEVEGTHSSIVEHVKQADAELKSWAESMAQFTHLSATDWLNRIHKKDLFITPSQCLELGIADVII